MLINSLEDCCNSVSGPLEMEGVFSPTISFVSHRFYCFTKIFCNIIDQIFLLVLCSTKDVPELSWLDKIGIGELALKVSECSNPLFMSCVLLILCWFNDRRLISGWDVVLLSSVVCNISESISSRWVVSIEGPIGRVLVEVYPKTVSLR